MSKRMKALEEALKEALEVFELVERPAFPDPAHHERVKKLGLEIGFGALMSTASAGWREVLIPKGLSGGEFVSGPCKGTVDRTLRIIREALKVED